MYWRDKMRIHVMGPPGSGKTTLARRLAYRLNVPFYELDSIAWVEGYPGTERSLEDRLHDVHHIASQPAWITEGIFLFWTDELLHTADYLIWLDMPWRLIIRRVIARRLNWSFRGHITGENPPTDPLKQLRLLWYLALYYLSKNQAETRAFIARYLMAYRNKVIRCRRPSEVEMLFMRLLAQAQGNVMKS
jgi:adenylate kinase family enzyme